MSSRIPPIFTVLVGTIALLAIATPFSVSHFLTAQDIRRRALAELAACNALCKEINILKASVPDQEARNNGSEETISRVRQGLLQSGIDEKLLGDIKIIGKTAVPKTSFVREDALVTLKAIDLKSLFAFISSQESAAAGMMCSGIDIQVTKSIDGTGPALWIPQLTLTHLTKVAKRSVGTR
jgi:hypothetical protein